MRYWGVTASRSSWSMSTVHTKAVASPKSATTFTVSDQVGIQEFCLCGKRCSQWVFLVGVCVCFLLLLFVVVFFWGGDEKYNISLWHIVWHEWKVVLGFFLQEIFYSLIEKKTYFHGTLSDMSARVFLGFFARSLLFCCSSATYFYGTLSDVSGRFFFAVWHWWKLLFFCCFFCKKSVILLFKCNISLWYIVWHE